MAEKLKIIPLGGLDEIGKNCTVLEYGKDMIVIDCGVGFPDEDMYGVDLVIPDFTYLTQNAKKLRGMFITHGHEDHIGSIPYCMQQVSCPIHGTAMTNGLIRLKLEEHRLQDSVKLVTHKPGDVVKAGCFTVEFIHVNHSIADAVAPMASSIVWWQKPLTNWASRVRPSVWPPLAALLWLTTTSPWI